ncbi:MAG: RNA methyltransferase [Polyangiales bacterium]
MSLPGVYLALLHYPIRSKTGGTITTSVTNLDLHDIARTGRTYGLRGYYVVTPIEAQHALIDHVLSYWNEGRGGERVPQRAEALSIVRAAKHLDAALAEIREAEGLEPELYTTCARDRGAALGYAEARLRVASRARPVVLVFGTGYGLADEVVARTDVHLAPVRPRGYNHLPVRSAVAIILDRLFGDDGADPTP